MRFLRHLALASVLTLSAQAEPKGLDAIFSKPMYKNSIWGLRVVDAASGEVLIEKEPTHLFYIGSVRKVFSVGLLLKQVGAEHTYDTPVYRQGKIDKQGVLHGNLIIKASGDLTMGGRQNPDGTLAVTNFDHNEADSLGNAELSAPDPLAGFKELARQIARSGIKQVQGEVIVDDRLFKPFHFRDQFDVTPMFVNDDVVDVSIPSNLSFTHRPHSAALPVKGQLQAGPELKITMEPEVPPLGATGRIRGTVPAGLTPALTNRWPLVRTFRIGKPSSYARTVLIEALQAQHVKVSAPLVEANPVSKLPAAYAAGDRVALLKGTPLGEVARFVLKVSYNIGADTCLMMLGVARGVNTMEAALEQERAMLVGDYGLDPKSFVFLDGSGGGKTVATNAAVTTVLARLQDRSVFVKALPILAVDGSLGFVIDFKKDPSLAGASGKVHAKTGTFLEGDDRGGLVVRGQAFGGYIESRSGRRLVYQLVVNEVPVTGIPDLMQIFQDQGTISAILWRDY